MDNTSKLESLAQSLRTKLIKGVRQRLRHWGFQENGEVEEAPEEIEGGYIFRGEVYSDPGVPKKWKALKGAIGDHGLKYVAEEAAYTWFNRLMALRILEKNGHISKTVGYAEDTSQPAVLYGVKQSGVPEIAGGEKEDVQKAIKDSNDDRAFRHLLIGVCQENSLLSSVFGRVDDFTELLLPEGLLQPGGIAEEIATTGAISEEDFGQVELIGWLYQFYISEKKDAVYDAGGKFQPEDIPAATQIFTPRWIVRYMVENTIGKQWLEKYPESPLRGEMEYLVENDQLESEQGTAKAAVAGDAGGDGQVEVFSEDSEEDPTGPIFDELPELELFDPAAGSAHILVVGFDLLMKMYRERGYTDEKAVELILTENLKGLEIDRRAAQLARFALLMKAAQYDHRALDRDALRPEVYAMPEPRESSGDGPFSNSELRRYFGDDVFDLHGAEIKEALDLIKEHGQNVGSALKLDLPDEAREATAERMAYWDEKVQNRMAQLDEQALHQELRSYLKPLLLSTAKYPAVAMNPPYMGSSQMNGALKTYTKDHYPKSKRDLSAIFIEVGEALTRKHGRLGMINQQSWMFLKSYSSLRDHLINNITIISMAHLGANAFREIGGEVVQSVVFTLILDDPDDQKGVYFDLRDYKSPEEKEEKFTLRSNVYSDVEQKIYNYIPKKTISYWISDKKVDLFKREKIVDDFAEVRLGLCTGDNNKFLRMWHEVNRSSLNTKVESFEEAKTDKCTWVPHNKGGKARKWYGIQDFVIRFDSEGVEELSESCNKLASKSYYFKESVAWGKISTSEFRVRYMPRGFTFNVAGPSIFGDEIPHVLAFLNSRVADDLLRVISSSMDYNGGDVEKLPFKKLDQPRRGRSIQLANQCVSFAKEDWDSRETSWDFAQHPLAQQDTDSLKAAYAAWKEKSTDDFLGLHANEEELNDLFIELYGLEDELSPRVDLGDITILEDELDRDALGDLDDERDKLSEEELRARFLEDDPGDALFEVEVPIHQFLSYGIGVMLGRYRLGRNGLHIAHPSPSDEELAPYQVPMPLCGPGSNGTETFEIDDDAIVPLMGRDSPFSDDAVVRMREIVRLIWGEETLTENLNFINHALSVGRGRGLKRNYEKTMEEWLVGDFWDWHKGLYSVPYYGKKPIYWLFQSPEGHFQVLAYMHRMDKFTPQRVRQDYLQRHQEYLRSEIESLEAKGEETLSGDEAGRLDTLREAVADCREYDAILKDVADQQIEIDLDEGVQNNYPKFEGALADL